MPTPGPVTLRIAIGTTLLFDEALPVPDGATIPEYIALFQPWAHKEVAFRVTDQNANRCGLQWCSSTVHRNAGWLLGEGEGNPDETLEEFITRVDSGVSFELTGAGPTNDCA